MLMKTFNQFMKEASYSVYGQATLGSTPGTASAQQIKSGVDRAIKNIGTGMGSGQIGQRGKFGLTGGVNVSMSGSTSTSNSTKTKIKPNKTTDPIKSTPNTNTQEPIRPTPTRIKPTLNKVTQPSTTTPNRTLTKSRSSVMNPITKRISDYRMSTM